MMQQKTLLRPLVVAVTGISTAGKTYIAQAIPQMSFYPLVSITTRPMRPGELPGFDYHYVGSEEFDGLARAGSLIEFDSFAGYHYGLPHDHFQESLSSGLIACHVCTPAGVSALRTKSQTMGFDLVSVWVDAPVTTVIYRMCKRWMMDSSLDKNYLAERLALAISVEPGWDGYFNYTVSDSGDLLPVIQDVLDRRRVSVYPEAEYKASKPDLLEFDFVSKVLHEVFMPRSAPRNADQLNDLVSDILVALYH